MRTDLDKLPPKRSSLLCEGMAVRAVCRITGLDKNTLLRAVVRVGRGVAELSEQMIRGLTVAEVECDELWAFFYCKSRTQRKCKIAVRKLATFTAISASTETQN